MITGYRRLAMLGSSSRLALAGLAGTLALPAHAQLLTHRDLSYSVAKAIAEATIESCEAKGYRVSVVVVDRDGETIVALRGDNASPHTMENARRKAYTALSFRVSTTEYAKRYASDNPLVRQQVTLPSVIAIPGGLPVKAGDDVIGGAGASGSPGVDEPCVQAGLDKVADLLK
jgi:uncharacterized protein GlcG (DUF336 family)